MAMMKTWILVVVWLGLVAWGQAGLKDILEVDQNKTNDMAERLFDTKTFQTRTFDANKEFRSGRFDANRQFQTGQRFDPGGRAIPVEAAEIFTGSARLSGVARGFERRSPLEGREAETRGRLPVAAEANPLGERNYRDSTLKYEGRELSRRTRELEVMERALRDRESKEGRVLSMSEVKEILNKYE